MIAKKRIIALLLSFLIILTVITPIPVFAEEQDALAQYSGSTTASYGYKPYCTFTINKIVRGEFKGEFFATNLGTYDISQSVEGQVYENYDSFTCVFSLDNYYDTSFVVTVYPFEGYCECISSGTWHFVDFRMTGTKFSFNTSSEISGNSEFNESDLEMCMVLSSSAYKKKIKNNQLVPLKDCIVANGFDLNTEDLRSYNYMDENNNQDSNKDDVAFSITYRKIDDDNVDVIVVIRGSYNDEWGGNAELTGETYTPNSVRHENFEEAKNNIKEKICNYIKDYLFCFPYVNLIITGHSRGAAVANLYAKEAIDQINGSTTIDGIPNFNKVTAYTFACPNVEKYNDTMENYSSIFNFCLCEDLVPTIPLTYPSDGWNYWKYGITYITDLDYKYFWNCTEVDNRNTRLSIYAIHTAFSSWNSVEEYYNKPIGEDDDYTTLYNFFIQTASEWKSVESKPKLNIRLSNLIKRTNKYPEIAELVKYIAIGSDSVLAHSVDFYEPAIENYNHVDRNGVSLFRRYTYQNCLYDFENKGQFAENINNLNSRVIYDNSLNENEIENLEKIYGQSINTDLIGWDIDDPSTWEGITWNADGNVESIDLSFKNLSGELDLSGFSSLKSLDLSGNEITGVTLSNCSSLEEIDCSFNKLTSLDLSDCTSLTSVTCCYNNLDTHEGGTLYNTLDDLMFDDVYVNYYPQSVPDNATFNTTELNALKTFANTDNNESVLDWLDDDGNIDTEKLQNNVLFEYDGSNYRVVAIDVSELDVSGALNLTSLSLLQDVYCENTKITSLNVNGCTKLETLQCDGCDITTLTLPSNAADKNTPLYDVSCEYNYIDTSIFTPTIVEYVNFKAGANLEYENQKGDSSALQAALSFANKLEEKDYSASTYEILKELLDECNYYNFDNLYLTQSDIDSLTSDILTAVYNLKAYFKVDLSSPNGNMNIEYAEPDFSNDGNSAIELPDLNDEEVSVDNEVCSLLYGTRITLYVTPKEGYSFVGWYDTTNNRYLSRNSQYSFKVDSNVNLKAVIVPDASATLTFSNYSNWIAGTVTKTTLEWAEITTINDLLPDVPYRYGYSNGRWVYDESDVIAKLQAGEDVTIGAEYDDDNTSLPTPRTATDKPELDLYYSFDEDNSVGSFVMAAGFPENIQVESIGMAFYYRSASVFDPTDNFTLLLNNKMLVSRFNVEEPDDIYITNIKNMSATNNWSARGFVTYYDTNGDLITEYSNQINIIDTKNANEIPLEEPILPDENFN